MIVMTECEILPIGNENFGVWAIKEKLKAYQIKLM